MSNTSVASLGRFSSQILTYLGTQRSVKDVAGNSVNSFKYATGPTVFTDPASFRQSDQGAGVVGSMPVEWYNSTRCYFLGRGASSMYADAMTALVIDIATALGTTPQALLESAGLSGKLALSDNAYTIYNMLRDPGNQVGTAKSVSNRNSIKSREIRS